MTDAGTPVVFIHGLWLHNTSWGSWEQLFRESGYEPVAPGWPGESATVEETNSDPAKVAGYGIDDVVEHYAQIIRALPARPVAVGPAPIKGVLNLPISALRVASVALRSPANRRLAVSLTAEQFRYGFGNALPQRESAELYERWTVPSPGRPLFEAALANFTPHSPAAVNTRSKTRGPLLITAGGQDHTVPKSISTATRKLYHKSPAITDLVEFPDRGHSLTIDSGWREVAEYALDWLNKRHLTEESPAEAGS